MQLYANEEVNKNDCLGSLLEEKNETSYGNFSWREFSLNLLEYLGRMLLFNGSGLYS